MSMSFDNCLVVKRRFMKNDFEFSMFLVIVCVEICYGKCWVS